MDILIYSNKNRTFLFFANAFIPNLLESYLITECTTIIGKDFHK